jgi:hypothetical protein
MITGARSSCPSLVLSAAPPYGTLPSAPSAPQDGLGDSTSLLACRTHV